MANNGSTPFLVFATSTVASGESSDMLLLGKYDYMISVIPGLIPGLPIACINNRWNFEKYTTFF
ncbi:hypothetical protein [Apilactobacillus kunkeei]|uniref:hypothetical protein n=1 Tax=Apilactobacillus kunkeei TaxID=148814 RepID=UPI001129D0FA|nr:hypothetical protein [Apilactobacillus kunkeei]